MRGLYLSALAVALFPRALAAQSANPDLSSGGLAPPPAVESKNPAEQPATPPGSTENDLARSETEDSGRGLEFFWLNGEVGGGHFGLGSFNGGDLVERSEVETKQTGLVTGAGLGVRLVFLTLGARFRYAPFKEWNLWTLGAEGGVHIPLGALEPYFTLGLGYASIKLTEGKLDAAGFDGRLGAGLDWYLTNMFSVGANLTGDVLVLARKKVSGAPAGSVYAADGSSVGGGVTLTFVMGLHF